VSKQSDREIRVERIFDAPRDQVFAAFIDPERIPQWWGPRETTTVVEEMDPAPGGRWRYLMRTADGEETRFKRHPTARVTAPRADRADVRMERNACPHLTGKRRPSRTSETRPGWVNISVFHHPGGTRWNARIGHGRKGLNETYDRLDEVLAG